jgi:hypothetical protein
LDAIPPAVAEDSGLRQPIAPMEVGRNATRHLASAQRAGAEIIDASREAPLNFSTRSISS